MQKPTRYYITKSGEEPTVRSVRVEKPVASMTLDEARSTQAPENTSGVECVEQRRTVKDLVQDAIHKRHFFS
jgi:hypothetical protein